MIQRCQIGFGNENIKADSITIKRKTRADIQKERAEQYTKARMLDAQAANTAEHARNELKDFSAQLGADIAQFNATKEVPKPSTGYAAGVEKTIAKFRARRI